MKTLILGSNSAIAKAVAHILAKRGEELYLASRNYDEALRTAKDIGVRYGVKTHAAKFDATDFPSHGPFFQKVLDEMGEVDRVLIAFGQMGDEDRATRDFQLAKRLLDINFTGVVSILTHVVPYMEERGKGVIAVISSVAGDRVRSSLITYGTAKAALSAYLSGLRNRLHSKGVKVVTIKPGYVRTPMTANLKMPKPLVSSPERVARYIVKAMDEGKDVVYAPWYWWCIMAVLKAIPEAVFKRLNIGQVSKLREGEGKA